MPLELSTEEKKIFSKPIVKRTDMTMEKQLEATEVIQTAIDSYATVAAWESAARQIKDQLDKRWGASWHCVIGEGFGFDITFHSKSMMYMYYDKIGILVYKA